MSLAAEPITVPGVYDIPAEDYHADPVPEGSLSSSGARRLLPPSCPALYRHEQDNPQGPKKTFDLGHAAHKVVLCNGPDLVVVPGERWDTKATKQRVAEVRASGAVPLKEPEYEQVHAMADALREHPVAAALFDPEAGLPEQSLFWADPATEVWRRARLDFMPFYRPTRMVIPDYKSTTDASPDAIQKAIYNYGYHQQAPWYLDAITALEIAEDPAFVFVFQEKQAPFLVTVVELDVVALKIGRALNRQAIELYKACRESGRWPGYADDIVLTPLPGWAEAKHLAEIS